jgi:hypothetical protein
MDPSEKLYSLQPNLDQRLLFSRTQGKLLLLDLLEMP